MARLTNHAKLLRYLSSSGLLTVLSIMAITPQDIANEAGKTARNILAIPAGVIGDAYAGYIKDPPLEGLIPNVGVGVARQACRRYADNPDGLPGAVAAGFERVCRPYLDDIGYGAAPTIEKPFEGGQCQAVYLVTYTARQGGEIGAQATIAALGPVQGIRGRISETGARLVELNCKGVNLGSDTCIGVGNSGQGWYLLAGLGSSGPEPVAVIDSLSPCGADNCGNPPPVFTKPKPPEAPGPVREPYSPGPGVNIDIDLEIGPQGNITFNIGTGPVVIDPFGGGGGGDDGGGSPVSGLPPGDIGSPDAPVPTDPTGKASGCAPANSVLVGVKVNIVASPPYGSQYDPLVRRGVCYVYMGTSTNLGLIPEGVAMRSGQMFFAPLDNLTCWEVNANTGYVLQVIPYYRALEPEEV